LRGNSEEVCVEHRKPELAKNERKISADRLRRDIGEETDEV